MANPKFKIGDKVRITGVSRIEYQTGSLVPVALKQIGEIHKIVHICKLSGVMCYSLSDSMCIFDESVLEAVKNENKIVITTDGTTTRAALYDGHKLIREAKAICSKDDTFDFEMGAKIAFERLTAKPAVKAKPKNGILYNMDDVVNYLKPRLLRNGDENYDSNGVKLSVYNNVKQITVMEVKEG